MAKLAVIVAGDATDMTDEDLVLAMEQFTRSLCIKTDKCPSQAVYLLLTTGAAIAHSHMKDEKSDAQLGAILQDMMKDALEDARRTFEGVPLEPHERPGAGVH